MPSFQCWVCGSIVPSSSVVRRDMVTRVSSTYGSGRRSSYSSSTTRAERVNLCVGCAAEQDRQEAARRRRAAVATLIGLVVVLCIGAVAAPLVLQEIQVRQERQQQEANDAERQAKQRAAEQLKQQAEQEAGERAQREQQEQAEREARQRAEQEQAEAAKRQRAAALARLEKRAKRHVDYAKKLIDAGETPKKDLRDRLDKIIKDFAGTTSAEEAKRLRAELGKE